MHYYFGRTTASTDREWDSYLHINNFGLFQDVNSPLEVSRTEGRADYQIIAILEGSVTFMFDGKKVELGKNNWVLYRPHEEQFYCMNIGATCFWIHFSGSEASSMLERLSITEKINKLPSSDFFYQTFRKMTDSTIYTDTATEERLNSYFISMLTKLCSAPVQTDAGIGKVIKLMKTEGFKGLTTDEYARLSGLSEYHFIRKFRSVTGKTPHQYKAEIICENAVSLLSETNLNISEIATVLGFEDSLYFSRFFKKHTGVSPTKYKK